MWFVASVSIFIRLHTLFKPSESLFKIRYRCTYKSIGIVLLGSDELEVLPVRLIDELGLIRVVLHSEILSTRHQTSQVVHITQSVFLLPPCDCHRVSVTLIQIECLICLDNYVTPWRLLDETALQGAL